MKLFIAFLVALLLLMSSFYADLKEDEYMRGFNDGYNKYIETFLPIDLFNDLPVKRPNPKLIKKEGKT